MKPARRLMVLLMLFLGALISYLNRAALPLVAPAMQKQLAFNSIQMGYVYSSFFVGYALFNFIGGRAADRWGAYKVCAVSVAAWSVCSLLTAGAHSLSVVIGSRMLLGASEGPFGAAGVKLLSGLFKKREAASAIGTFSSGTPLGGAFAGPFVSYFAGTYDWRIGLMASALLGALWLAAWITLPFQRRARSPSCVRNTAMQRKTIANAETTDIARPPASIRDFLIRPLVLATAMGFFGYSYVLTFFITWFPAYLSTTLNLSAEKVGLQMSIIWLLGFCGLLLGGRISDLIYRITGNAFFSRKWVIVGGLTISAAGTAILGCGASMPVVIVAMSTSMFALYLTGALYWTIVQDNVPANVLGGVSGFIHALSNAAGFIGPVITGYIITTRGSFNGAFLLAGGVAIIGALSVMAFVRPAVGVRSDPTN